MWVWLIYTRGVLKQAVKLESTASAVTNTVGLEASFSTTLSVQRIGVLKCMYFDNNYYKVTCTYHSNKWTTLFKTISGENPAYRQRIVRSPVFGLGMSRNAQNSLS